MYVDLKKKGEKKKKDLQVSSQDSAAKQNCM